MDYENLDPEDWNAMRQLAHQITDKAIDYTSSVRERPVWQDMPERVRASFTTSAPQDPTPLAQIVADVNDTVYEYPMGNIHPRFWAWYMGTSNVTGALADFMAAIQGSNLGGGANGSPGRSMASRNDRPAGVFTRHACQWWFGSQSDRAHCCAQSTCRVRYPRRRNQRDASAVTLLRI